MNRVIEILMRRDGVTKEEAEVMIDNCRAELIDCTNIIDADEIIANELGLEPDYLDDILWGI